MGARFSKKNQNTQYPYGVPYAVPYPPPHKPFVPPYGGVGGFGHTMFPQPHVAQQGFIPPASYGTAQFGPPPLLNWLPQEKNKQRKKKKSRRTQSEKFVGGFAGEARATEGQIRRGHSESHHRSDPDGPVVPGRIARTNSRSHDNHGSMKRMPTPFIPARDHPDEESEDRFERSRRMQMPAPEVPNLQRAASRHSEIHFPSPHVVDGKLDNVLAPMEPANRAVFGPTGQRPRTPLKNPLPAPPRDLYEMTPYKSLLSLPQTTALLTATYGSQQLAGTSTTLLGAQPSVQRKKSNKGLFRAFSKKEKHKEPEQPKVTFIPVFVPRPDGSAAQTTDTLHRSVSQTTYHPSISVNPPAGNSHIVPQNTGNMTMPMPQVPQLGGGGGASNFHQSGGSSATHETIAPIPPTPMHPPPVRFNQETTYNAFMNHSPHRIMYRNKIYPTALHLYESMKFIDQYPEIADNIRLCQDVHDVYPMSAKFHELQRSDWSLKYIELMDEVLELKFKQNPDLRSMILGTGTSDIVYDDYRDEFWGLGNGQGQNQLGKALVRVREKLRNEAN